MEIHDIELKAERLQSLLVQYSPHNETAKSLLSVLKPLLQEAIAGSIQTPVEWNSIPADARLTKRMHALCLAWKTPMPNSSSPLQAVSPRS